MKEVARIDRAVTIDLYHEDAIEGLVRERRIPFFVIKEGDDACHIPPPGRLIDRFYLRDGRFEVFSRRTGKSLGFAVKRTLDEPDRIQELIDRRDREIARITEAFKAAGKKPDL